MTVRCARLLQYCIPTSTFDHLQECHVIGARLPDEYNLPSDYDDLQLWGLACVTLGPYRPIRVMVVCSN